MTASGARIIAHQWGFRYPGRSTAALSQVSFTVEPGELVVLMGASGSGKSTLLAGLAGTLPADGATGGLTVAAAGPQRDAPARVGLVQQEPEGNIVMELVGDDIAFPLENAAVATDRIWPRVADALEAVGLSVSLNRATARLSGGQQQLLAIAAASVAAPELLLLDEPTANLDPDSAARVVRAVLDIRARTGCTVVVVEHRVAAWLEQADRALLAVAGSITSLTPQATRAHLAAHPDVAARLWIDQRRSVERTPASPAGAVMVEADGLAVAGRLSPISLTVRSGEVVALTGPPGSGKSTLLACLSGLLEPMPGSVRVHLPDGPRQDPWRWPSADVAATFGVVFQNPEHQFITARVSDELRHGLVGAGVPEPAATARAHAMLDRLRLAHLADANPFTLSGGEQRRLSVGTALVLDPGILLLDEPTFGQDPTTWSELVDIIASHRDAGGAVVIATHDPDLVQALGAREVPMAAVHAAESDGGDRIAPLRRLDPLALVGAAALISAGALVSASVALNVTLAVLSLLAAVLGGLPLRRVALLATPAALACASVALSNALLSETGINSAQAWAAAALPASRVLAVAIPGLVAAVALDPTGLADALVVRLRVPARAAYSALAGFRLLPLLSDEWTILSRASRARGLGGTGAADRARQFGSMTFRLLVAALRRGARLAVALDARGLRAGAPRTVARRLHWGPADTAALLVGAMALTAAAATRV